MDVRDILDSNARRWPDKVAIIHRDRPYTYRWLADQTSRLAQGLTAHLDPGELLALWLPNGPELVCLYLACLRCGVVPMPLHHGMKWPEVSAVLEHSQARLLVVGARPVMPDGADLRATRVERMYALDPVPSPGAQSWTELMRGEAEAARARATTESPGFVLHTSGSEGRSKGVMLSYANLNHILDFRLAQTRLSPESVSVVASCLTQSVGLHQCLALLAAGGTMVLLEDYDVVPMVRAIHQYRPTHLIMVVNAFDRLLGHPDITARSLDSVIFAAVGADRVTPGVQNRYIALTGKPLNVSYGMTESSWAIVNFEGRQDKCLALGKPGPGVTIRLVNRQGQDAAIGEIGEIRIRSPRTMLGYLRNETLTRAAFVDGWLVSGDLAYRDSEGYYWFAGRNKQIIVLSTGDTVSPVEVEAALLAYPGVVRCVVLPAGQAEDGSEVPVALVERRDHTVSETALRAYLEARLSAYKVPRRIVFVSALPVGATGKVWRRAAVALWPG